MLQQAQLPTRVSGQVGVIVILIMTVLLTVGLSVASNTSRDVKITQQEEESSRVFNAAEAGVEEALSGEFAIQGPDTSGTLNSISDIGVEYSVTKLNELETRLFEGVAVGVNVSGAVNGNGLRILFSKEDTCGAQDPASLMISIYSVNGGVSRARYLTAAACDHGDGFEDAVIIPGNGGYYRRVLVDLQTGDELVRITPVYNDTHIEVSGNGWTLPVQSYAIRSEATSEIGNETRIVQVNRSLPTAPSVFDFALYSGTTLVK